MVVVTIVGVGVVTVRTTVVCGNRRNQIYDRQSKCSLQSHADEVNEENSNQDHTRFPHESSAESHLQGSKKFKATGDVFELNLTFTYLLDNRSSLNYSYTTATIRHNHVTAASSDDDGRTAAAIFALSAVRRSLVEPATTGTTATSHCSI